MFYIVGAVAADFAFKALYHGDPTILIGASGAISATMGAFLVFYGNTEITFWYWLYMRTGTFQLAAFFALPLWLGEQVLWAYVGRGQRWCLRRRVHRAHRRLRVLASRARCS